MGKEFEYVFDVAGATSGEVRQGPVNDGERNKVVYIHKRESDGLPFYLGIGNADRPYVTTGRNDYWAKVYKKHGRIVEILHENLTWDEACEIEIRLIAEYKSKYPDSMTNLTDGGEGGLGLTGEDHGRFKGHILFLSVCGKYFYICSGGKSLEDAGFHYKNVYSTITGSNNCESVTSKKIHINGVKVRFKKPIRFNDESEIDDSLIANRVEANVSNDEIVGQAGELHNRFKGYALGVSKSHFILLAGYKDMKSKNFHPGSISNCISGKRQSHNGMKWFRIDENITQESLKTLRDLQPFDQDSKDRLEELLTE